MSDIAFVKDIYKSDVKTIHMDLLVHEALSIMLAEHMNALVVVDDRQQLKGILTVKDMISAALMPELRANNNLARAMFKIGFFEEGCAAIRNQKVQDIMQKDCMTAQLDTNIMEITAEYLRSNNTIIPVVDAERKVIGIVTGTDIRTKALAQGMGVGT